MSDSANTGRHNVALVGPYMSGKTTLLESILFATGTISRKGSVKDGNTVGDGSTEARDRQMSIEVGAADAEHGGTSFTFLDCPGSVEFAQDTHNALMGADLAVVSCEAEAERVLTLASLFKFLNDRGIPHLLFVNRIDQATQRIAPLMDALQRIAGCPLLLRQVPVRDGETVTGYVDLIAEEAYRYQEGGAAEKIEVPDDVSEREGLARTDLLERLADFDDALLETLLEEKEPPAEEILAKLKASFVENKVVPVFLGSAERGWGVPTLLDVLAREAPDAAQTAARKGVEPSGSEPLAQVLKTYNTQHGGKLSLVRVWRGTITDGMTLGGERVSGVYRMFGQQTGKAGSARAGEIVALGRLENVATGDTLGTRELAEEQRLERAPILRPVYGLAVTTEKREDEVKMTTAIAKVSEEDPSLSFEQNPDTRESVLWGQGEIHLQVALERLRNRYNLTLKTAAPKVPYKEAIRKPTSQHGRFKRQTGGHGQFGDVHLDVKPLPRGSGFTFEKAIVGGAVPKQYIPAVEAGVRDALEHGPLGFPVVDIAVALTDGQHHAVDSSDQAFRQAARIAMNEAMPKCAPVLLEPIYETVISIPSEYTPKAQRLISGRRGQILGFGERPGWAGWDEVTAHLPQAELHDLIIELRSLTQGIGTYEWKYDHLQELTGRVADKVLEAKRAEA